MCIIPIMTEISIARPEVPHRISSREIPSTVRGIEITSSIFGLPDGKSTKVTVIKSSPSAKIGLRVDPRFTDQGIELDNSRLINQPGTQSSWNGETVGIRPEDFIKDDEVPTIAFDPTNA